MLPLVPMCTEGNNVYRCKLCTKEFTGSKIVVATCFDSRVSTQQLRKCIAQKPADLVSDLETLIAERTNNAKKKRHTKNHSLNRGPSIISGKFAAQAQLLANAAILRFIVSQGQKCVVFTT